MRPARDDQQLHRIVPLRGSGDADEESGFLWFVSDIFNNGVSRERLVDCNRKLVAYGRATARGLTWSILVVTVSSGNNAFASAEESDDANDGAVWLVFDHEFPRR